ncbi:MAG: translation initiation factor IF-2 [Planctomycetota bacterium]
MPIRIYALAKDLKIDSKELADLCVKAGIPGKGSALASLDDDEVVKLKAFLAGATRRPPARPVAAPDLAPIPPSANQPMPGKPKYLPPTSGGGSVSAVAGGAASTSPPVGATGAAMVAADASASPSFSSAQSTAAGTAIPASAEDTTAGSIGNVSAAVAPTVSGPAAVGSVEGLAVSDRTLELEPEAAPAPAVSKSEAAQAGLSGLSGTVASGMSSTAAGAVESSEKPGDARIMAAQDRGSGVLGAPLATPSAAAAALADQEVDGSPKGASAGDATVGGPGVPATGPLSGRSSAEVGTPAATAAGPAVAPASPAGTPTRPRPGAGGPPPLGFTRQDYIPPGGATGRIRILENRGGKKPGEGADTGKTPPLKRREPVINLAKLPEVKQPTPAQRASEPPAQKPEMRLPKDAIRGAKAGARPPLEHLTQKPDARKPKPAGSDRGPGAGGGQGAGGRGPQPAPVAAGDTPLGKAMGGRSKKQRDGGPEGPEAEKELAGMASSRADRQKARKLKPADKTGRPGEDDDDSMARRRARRLTRRSVGVSTAAPRKDKIEVEAPCSVREFSEATGVGSGQILKVLMSMGVPVNINANLNLDQVELIAAELGLDIEIKAPESLEDTLLGQFKESADDPATLKARPPVVTFLGHVDHGKTSLLDRIIGINVASGEAGGITQHIRAYEITKNGRKIAFVDTPGHEAFTEMRARGANVTDIAVLVVAADDGVMPQTEEAISHAKAAGVPIVVALNKMDLPGAKPDRVLQQLAAQGLMPSEWSGDVEVIRCSAMTGAGLDELLETLLVTADLHEYKANPDRAASGVCLEAEQEAGRGVIAKVMVKNGTLNVGDIVVCGAAHGRVKAMYDTLRPDHRLKKAGPSTPVNLTGLDLAPQAGDAFHVLTDIAQAREIAASRANARRETTLAGTSRVSFEQFQQILSEGRIGEKREIVTLNLILRADVRGSIEAIQKELGKFSHPEVQLKLLQASVGGITVADVTLASASDAVIIGFNVIPDDAARTLAEERQVEIRRYDIIYKVTDDIKAMIEGKLKPEERVVELGQAIVKQTFAISRVGTVAGCYVARGTIERGCRVRVFRDGRVIGEYAIDSLKREKDDAKEVSRGMECGIRLAGFNDVKKDDIFEAYKIEEVARTL